MRQFRNLVFEGGGVWGIAYEGVLTELVSQGAIDPNGIVRVGGASAGAITAMLLSVGYRAEELGAILRETSFDAFRDDQAGMVRDCWRLLRHYGWYRGDRFKQWLEQLLSQKIVALSREARILSPAWPLSLTGLAVWRQNLSLSGINLPAPYVVATNLTQQRREIYSAESGHQPGLLLVDAVRRSMAIPFFFACVRNAENDVIVDGGLTWNYPLRLFDHRRYCSLSMPLPANGQQAYFCNPETLGIRVDSSDELKPFLKAWESSPRPIETLLDYIVGIVSLLRSTANKSHLNHDDWRRTIFVDVGNKIGVTDFNLTPQDQEFLSAAGREGARKYLDWLCAQDARSHTSLA